MQVKQEFLKENYDSQVMTTESNLYYRWFQKLSNKTKEYSGGAASEINTNHILKAFKTIFV